MVEPVWAYSANQANALLNSTPGLLAACLSGAMSTRQHSYTVALLQFSEFFRPITFPLHHPESLSESRP